MGALKSQTASELKRLPLTLGKLAGAFIAVISLTWAVIIATRRSDFVFSDAWPLIVSGVLGILVFILCDVAGKKHHQRHTKAPSMEGKKEPRSLVPWMILLALAGVFIIATMVATR
ncbi:MAG: hypothetical protein ABIL58_12240 [Pseudomonadota bacterium]